MNRWQIIIVISAAIALLALPLHLQRIGREPKVATTAPLEYVGREACKECHEKVYKKWKGSDHDRSMDIANSKTVLGNFNNTTFTRHDGSTARFFRDGDRFMVHIEGEDGKLRDFQIMYVFGYDPLQQYLIPTKNGQVQSLTIAWDIPKKCWFDLYAGQDIPAGDWLHWTGRGQTWNTMCADCHSTNLVKGYDPETETYKTTWSEINVSCEACHGPGSAHVAWAKSPPLRRKQDPSTGLAVKTSGLNSKQFVNHCAPCHSRRQVYRGVSTGGNEILNDMSPELLRQETYYADGQVLGEDYVFGSFLQSKMYENDVSCRDCHDSHSLKHPFEGNALCTQCHRKEVYDTPKHHFHKPLKDGKPNSGAKCVACHMPERVYMGNDWRADHSIRIPRPDLTKATGSPDACCRCHMDKPLQHSIDACRKWYGEAIKPHSGTILAEARKGVLATLPQLIRTGQDDLLPEIVRATAVVQLASYPPTRTTAALVKALSDKSAMVRRAALFTLGPHYLEPKKLIRAVAPALRDPVLGVRIAAVPVLAPHRDQLSRKQMASFTKAKAEFIKATNYSADLPGNRLNLANLASALGDSREAERQYRKALALDARFAPAAMNLSVLLNADGRNQEARKLLEMVVAEHPEFGEAAYSLGLLLGEMREYDKAIIYLRKAEKAMPNNPRVLYNLGQLLLFKKKPAEGVQALKRCLTLAPGDERAFVALAQYYFQKRRLTDVENLLKAFGKNNPKSHLLPQVEQALKDARRAMP